MLTMGLGPRLLVIVVPSALHRSVGVSFELVHILGNIDVVWNDIQMSA